MSFALSLLTGVVLGSLAMFVAAWSIWWERKFAARLQSRPGPTEVGPIGLPQPLADGLKLMQKEIIIPRAADKLLFVISPAVAAAGTLALFAVIPWSETVGVAGDLNIGLLWIFAVGALLVLPQWVAGWASNNKYALLGAMRSAAQSVSYEVPLLLSGMVPILLAGSFQMDEIVAAQQGGRWFAFWPPGPGALAFGLFYLCSLAEANRIPFDIPEAESELIGGVTTEHTGMIGVVLQLAEYLHTLVTAAVCATLFFGGWEGPGAWFGMEGFLAEGLHWMVLKTLVLFALVFWIRWSWMRYRSDQLLKICWHYLIPASLALLAVTAIWVRLVEGA